MNKWMLCFLLISGLISCNSRKNQDSTKAFFSVVDYLKAQVKQMDTLPLRFTRITNENGVSDTAEITKHEFRKHAQHFLNLPDIASQKKMDNYSETNDFDEILNNVWLMYNAKNEEDEVRSETIMMQPDESGNTHVKTILVNTMRDENESYTEKNMTWHVGKRFQIVTKTNKPGQAEKINTLIVAWQ